MQPKSIWQDDAPSQRDPGEPAYDGAPSPAASGQGSSPNSIDLGHRDAPSLRGGKRRQGYGFRFKRWSANRVNNW
jgi:hypothetical protein